MNGAPQPPVWTTLEQTADDGFKAVAISVDRMPKRHESPCLGEEQEQDSIQHGERLLPKEWDRLSSTASEGIQQDLECLEHTGAERPAHLDPVLTRKRHCGVEEGWLRGERSFVSDCPEQRLRLRFTAE